MDNTKIKLWKIPSYFLSFSGHSKIDALQVCLNAFNNWTSRRPVFRSQNARIGLPMTLPVNLKRKRRVYVRTLACVWQNSFWWDFPRKGVFLYGFHNLPYRCENVYNHMVNILNAIILSWDKFRLIERNDKYRTPQINKK